MSIRTEKVGAMLREALATHFQRHLPEYLDGMITISSVKMSSDLRIAKVYVSIYRSKTDPEILIKRLNTHMPEIRKQLAGLVQMRFSPELRFYRDDTLDAAERIDSLLRSVRADESNRSERAEEGESTHDE
jgi:ribosome-binding factor A